ncbi:MAG: Gfo/Idh/MocA family oxidoreductase [Victivallales bacterium]|nr:Gfo/Idh/MocA family oxidoreductase [Victivallales bacterium]
MPIKTAIVGLDTSHAVELSKLVQDPTVPPQNQVHGLQVTRCFRFETPFQKKDGLDKRQAYLESIGVEVTEDFEHTVEGADFLMLEINDPARHLEYFSKCAELGKPIFLDKPVADTIENAAKIYQIAREKNIRFFSSSALRFDVDLQELLAKNIASDTAHIWGPIGPAAAGSSIVWYGVHTFEMLQAVMGRGAIAVTTIPDRNGVLCHVAYADGRRGIVEMTNNCYKYGALVRKFTGASEVCHVTGRVPFYKMLMDQIVDFIANGTQPVALEDTFEVMAMLDAAELSFQTGNPQPVFRA